MSSIFLDFEQVRYTFVIRELRIKRRQSITSIVSRRYQYWSSYSPRLL